MEENEAAGKLPPTLSIAESEVIDSLYRLRLI